MIEIVAQFFAKQVSIMFSNFWWHRHPCLCIAQTRMSVPPYLCCQNFKIFPETCLKITIGIKNKKEKKHRGTETERKDEG